MQTVIFVLLWLLPLLLVRPEEATHVLVEVIVQAAEGPLPIVEETSGWWGMRRRLIERLVVLVLPRHIFLAVDVVPSAQQHS